MYPELIYSLKYEDLAADPENQFRDVCRFLGLDYDPAVLSFYKKKAEVEKAYAGSEEIALVHKSLFNPISTDRMNLWKTEMSPNGRSALPTLLRGKRLRRQATSENTHPLTLDYTSGSCRH